MSSHIGTVTFGPRWWLVWCNAHTHPGGNMPAARKTQTAKTAKTTTRKPRAAAAAAPAPAKTAKSLDDAIARITFKDAAEQVLRAGDGPMKVKQIAELGDPAGPPGPRRQDPRRHPRRPPDRRRQQGRPVRQDRARHLRRPRDQPPRRRQAPDRAARPRSPRPPRPIAEDAGTDPTPARRWRWSRPRTPPPERPRRRASSANAPPRRGVRRSGRSAVRSDLDGATI